MRRALRRAAVIAAAVAAHAAQVEAQTSRDDLRDLVRSLVQQSGLGEQVQGISTFAALPGISAARFDPDPQGTIQSQIDRLILPLAHQFAGPRLLGGAPYLEATFGYSQFSESFDTALADDAPTRVDRDLRLLSALAGAGWGFALAERTILRPTALLGYSFVSDDTNLKGPDSEELEEVLDGILLNIHAHELLYGAALGLEHAQPLPAGLGLTASARYSHLWGHTLDASDEALDGAGNFGVFTAATTLDGPLGLTLGGRDLRWLTFVTHSRFPGNSGDAIGFDYFYELGGGLKLVDRDVVAGLDGFSLRASYITGDDVTGFSLGAKLEF